MSRAIVVSTIVVAPPALAASDLPQDWLVWIVIGGIGLLVVGIALRMVLAARFPKGYRDWAARRRESFEAHNDAWDRAEEEFRR